MAFLKTLSFDSLEDRTPTPLQVKGLDLVVIRYDDEVSVLYGRCLHRGALLADGFVQGDNLICGLHGWDYRYDTGVSSYNSSEFLQKFTHEIREGHIWLNEADIDEYLLHHPQPFNREEYQGQYADTHPESTEPYTGYIHTLAKNGLSQYGHHGPSASMGVDRNLLPKWEQIQFLPAQLSSHPLLDDHEVGTSVVIGPNAQKPLMLDIPLFVSDMSFGALSKEAKTALSKGAEMAGTGICSGEGGALPDEQSHNSRYFYELASAKFGFSWDKVIASKAFHFKAGQGAKTGTGGHLPGHKVTPEIAEVRGLPVGQTAISPATFTDMRTPADFRAFAEQVRDKTGGIPVGFKLAASHVEADIEFALDAGADYLILDGRGGGTGSAPTILRDNINVPTIPALARARKHLDLLGRKDITLVITGGLRVPEDFAKALMLGADAVAISNAALQAIGCLGMRACGTNNCPVGIATQQEHLRSRLIVDQSAKRLATFLEAATDLMKVIARACGHDHFSKFNFDDLSTTDLEMHRLTGISYAGINP
ncbi:glutamate synthase-related protein [Pontibacter sp. G13]|uniref:glutamate synthase-related protein n=1 Tax=Pontibacter sp. G13 TaxID=3074898 RepID=UPI00288AA798|nr:glutamate synthase-related protein [Pontibacter sp. G13]WNJ18354.1 glutamate synthase-related protein [Pontibacter sp. G13]